MELRQRTHEADQRQAPPAEPGGGGLDGQRAMAQVYLQAAHDAVENALAKGDSEEFLAANRQPGGE